MARLILPAMPGVLAMVAALDGQARLVGGVVRDLEAGQRPKDIDLATPFAPDAVIQRLERIGAKVVPTGIAHGTVTAILQGEIVEITTLRRDVATDGRRATVAYTDDWQEDAARRDFTINALYADPATGEIYDWFGGIADLETGIVRFIGEPLQRIGEDHLRILRFFRFHARFGKGAPDTASLAACSLRANDLMALSRERIADELLKMLALPDPAPIVALMLEQGIFAPVLPEIDSAGPLVRLVAREAHAGIAGDPVRRLCALLPADPPAAQDVAARLKLSTAQRKRMIAAAGRSKQDKDNPQSLAYYLGTEQAVDRLLLGDGDARAIQDWPVPVLPISGGAIVARGVKAGPDVARLLKAVEDQWVVADFPGKDRVDGMADAVVRQARSSPE